MGYIRIINQIILTFDPNFLEHPSAVSKKYWLFNKDP